VEATAVQTVAFDGQMQQQERFVSSAFYSFWAHRLGTLGAFFTRSVEKMEGKRRKYSPRLRRKELANRAGDSPRR
jgi:hypothetical protein